MPSYCKYCKRLSHSVPNCKFANPPVTKPHATEERKEYRHKANDPNPYPQPTEEEASQQREEHETEPKG